MRGMNDLVRQAQVMQKKIQKAQEELAEKEVEASVGGGMVTVVATGSQEIKSVKIDPQAVDPEDVPMLEDLVLAAVNEALKKSKDMAEEEMGALTGGMKIPGMF
ncbi:YbaB/EbfC family nucleoid-associated protein [Oceanidesulfovibrio marinus]|uniref:Nucleoid-associated protein DQK91_10165 n=1 Tax=Oceanidesulfovibrio marinus TaxID=370038 RepID=A0A6P1ZI40_9BACT|nr:YbaB/EbfC family nucleoid-associated protein [Oceanidesulfovibrio marinus]QJT10524.1 YbaB/EbfC family nucleoid-associated protein [Oceanidesulfovibrio marinus]TVM34282.1 YbaB/EbfC family nucleoid-associated protein [Oceanidesulfovibrio marinus]